jgi:mannose-6-phosphate isomerase-like protein (cupin superfamily)|tara:strand:- start:392 stop:691 length:300 start_codon:yes stop_codon:yes gene_type:complete
MQRKKAVANIQIDNERIRVTEYSFNKNEETGFHIHQWDYVVIPQTNGQLLLIDDNEVETTTTLLKGEPYYRKAGVSHNVINNGKEKLVFIEVEIKAHSI